MNKKKILVVDDEPDILQLLEISLSRMGLVVYKAANLGSAKYELDKNSFHLCLTDFKLPDGNGIELVEYAHANCPGMPIAVITAFGTINHAVEALKKGAYDFITKPISLDVLRNLVVSGLNINQDKPAAGAERNKLPGHSKYRQSLNQRIQKLASNTAPVIIYGKPGTEKGKMAHLIHHHSRHADKNLIEVDCENLGGQSLADLVTQAGKNGTLYFRHIEKLPQDMQGDLVDLLMHNPEDVRILSSTELVEEDLAQTVGFSKKLLGFLKINVMQTQSLSRHKEDISAFSRDILDNYAKVWKKLPCKLSAQALAKLNEYDFPGNIKELENILLKAAVSCEQQLIRGDDVHLSETGFQPHISNKKSLDEYIESIEIREITNALEKTNNNKTKAADLLGISFRALRYKISKLGIGKD